MIPGLGRSPGEGKEGRRKEKEGGRKKKRQEGRKRERKAREKKEAEKNLYSGSLERNTDCQVKQQRKPMLLYTTGRSILE